MHGKWETLNSTFLHLFSFKLPAASSTENIIAGSTKIIHVEDNCCETYCWMGMGGDL
jgi:hypothetical protein